MPVIALNYPNLKSGILWVGRHLLPNSKAGILN